MKKIMKVMSILLTIIMAASFPAAAFAEESDTEEVAVIEAESEMDDSSDELSITSDTYSAYYLSMDNYLEFNLYFLNGQMDLPYINVEIIPDLLSFASDMCGSYSTFSLASDGGIYQISAWNEYTALIDFDNDEVLFEDYNAFFMSPYDETLIRMVYTWKNAEGEYRYLAPGVYSFERYGREVDIDLSDYDIHLIHQEDLCLMPLQTFVDIFLVNYQTALLFNGEAIFAAIGSEGLPGELADAYYAVSEETRSEELIYYNYCELCLMLDMHYGLKEIHNIDYFDRLFKETGLNYYLLSSDPVEYTAAIQDLLYGYFADMHSSMVGTSRFVGKDDTIDNDVESVTYSQDSLNKDLFSNARQKYYPEGVPYYEEIGNTAYITFDAFKDTMNEDYYLYGLPEDTNEWDTKAIIIYANQMIRREDSPIENIVLDLSLNGGGTVSAAAYVAAWFLDEFNISSMDAFTGAQTTNRYYADINLNGEFDDLDSVQDYNLFCLTSPYSFSCGNLVPCSFKSTGTVTLLGKHTGGGACIVQPVSTADGTLFNISGNKRISTVNNGSFYDVDLGVEPDVNIVNLDNFYNREALTDFINNLF